MESSVLRPRRVHTSYGPLQAPFSSPTATSDLPVHVGAQRVAPFPEPQATSPSRRLDVSPPPALGSTTSRHIISSPALCWLHS